MNGGPDGVDDLIDLFHGEEARRLYDEVITEREHGEQCAALAVAEGRPDHLVIAALLHDVGHLILGDNRPIDVPLERNFHHDRAGAHHLAQWFGPAVTEPVRLHVEAKRYLCAVEPEYVRGLSASSVRSLAVQGGPMSAQEVARFEAEPFHADAVCLRRYDDLGKVEGLPTPPVDAYRHLLRKVAVDHPPLGR